MSCRHEEPLSFRSLYAGSVVSVREYCCRAGRGGPACEEYSNGNDIVLMRRGAFTKHFGRRTVTADVNQAVFFSKGATYRVSHPADRGDRGAVFTVESQALNDIVRELDPAIDEHPERPFPFVTSPCDSTVFWRRHALIERLQASGGEAFSPLWADETALTLVADVLQAALARHGFPRKRRRQATDAAHVERAEAAKGYLAERLGQRITLDEVARAVHASPFHLARVFRQRAGVPVHRYLNQLRLRAAVDRLADGAGDLASLALELGFSSHSHFADAFRREFGCTPSAVRQFCRRSGAK
jgi:AraC-like DNA-binding protein